MKHTEFGLQGNTFALLPQKAVLWPAEQVLIIADFHLGKASHFRKSGIPVPFDVFYKNAELFIQLMQWHKPQKVVFLGDLFHSLHNQEWKYFGEVLQQFAQTEFVLIKGNHDIMKDEEFARFGVQVVDQWVKSGLLFTHEPLDEEVEGQVNICGHIHPGVIMRGRGRQGLRLPCFYFDGYHFLLPAFGQFTGTYKMKPERHHKVFVIVENKVLKVN